jgi:hypothetical protein
VGHSRGGLARVAAARRVAAYGTGMEFPNIAGRLNSLGGETAPQPVLFDGNRNGWQPMVLARNLFLQNRFVTGFFSGSQFKGSLLSG